MSIILLRGFSQSGKDYVGNILCESYDYKRFAFADSLKMMVANEFNYPIEQLHSQEGKLKVCEGDTLKRTYRQILIDEALRLRSTDSGIFVKHCCNEISKSGANRIVITDWRYPNEIEIILQLFPNYEITPVHILRERQLVSPVNDISEHHLDNRCYDYQLINKLDNTIIDNIKTLIDFIEFNIKNRIKDKSKENIMYMGVYNLN
jgi:hypothetical protein